MYFLKNIILFALILMVNNCECTVLLDDTGHIRQYTNCTLNIIKEYLDETPLMVIFPYNKKRATNDMLNEEDRIFKEIYSGARNSFEIMISNHDMYKMPRVNIISIHIFQINIFDKMSNICFWYFN